MRTLSACAVWIAVLALADPSLAQSRFTRGDSNVDGNVNISDASHTLGYLFLGKPLSLDCEDAADSDDNGKVELTDAIRTLGFLFLGSAELPPPFGFCGLDPSGDGLTCGVHRPCAFPPPTTAPVDRTGGRCA